MQSEKEVISKNRVDGRVSDTPYTDELEGQLLADATLKIKNISPINNPHFVEQMNTWYLTINKDIEA